MQTQYRFEDFNSIKVRLKRTTKNKVYVRRIFQFHKGTIKTAIRLVKWYAKSSFQFHKGTIKTCG